MAPTHSRMFTDAADDAYGLFSDPPTGRKTFKMQNAKNGQKYREAVWPPELEKALFRGLIKYHPGTSKDRKALQRFPRRNKRISEYIKETQKKLRTAKQVGSRLQQLRETCTIPWVLDLINNKNFKSRRIPSSALVSLFGPDYVDEVPHFDGDASSPEPASLAASPRSSSSRTLVSAASDAAKTISRASTTSPTEPCFPQHQLQPPSFQQPTLPQPTIIIPVSLTIKDNGVLPVALPSFTIDLDEGLTDSLSVAPAHTPTRCYEVQASQIIDSRAPSVGFSSNAGRLPAIAEYRCVSYVYKNQELVYTDSHASPYLAHFSTNDASATYSGTTLVPDYWGVIMSNPEEISTYMITQEILLSKPDHAGAYKEVAPALFFIQYSLHVNFLPRAYNELAYTAVTNPDASSWAAYPGQDGVAMYGMDYTPAYVPDGAAYDFSDIHQSLPAVAPVYAPTAYSPVAIPAHMFDMSRVCEALDGYPHPEY